jgi:glycosyltransferase involved in cell wall biosynthesis
MKAQTMLPSTASCDVVVVADCSTDRTLEIAERMLRGVGVVVETDAGAVGVARALAAQVALERWGGPAERCWLANTDADCSVPRMWLRDQLEMAQAGAEAVAGIVDVDTFDEHEACVPERFRTSYVVHADGTHPHVHGANFGVRADAYLRAGGWGELCTAEDHDLWGRLHTVGSVRVSACEVKVMTSGRRVGRAPLGFAGALAAHNEVTA